LINNGPLPKFHELRDNLLPNALPDLREHLVVDTAVRVVRIDRSQKATAILWGEGFRTFGGHDRRVWHALSPLARYRHLVW